MINYFIFVIIVIGILFLVKYLLKTRNDKTPDIPEPPQDSMINYPD